MSNSGSGNTWVNVNNSMLSNNSYAVIVNKGTSQQLTSKSYNFNLLSTDVIEGIQLDVERKFIPGLAITRISNWVENENSNIPSFNIPTGNERMLMVVVGAENGTTQATYNVTYNGISLTKATSIVVSTGFTATLEVWYLRETNMPAGASTADIVVTASAYTPIEYFTSIAAAVYQNVDQTDPFESFIAGSNSTNTSTFTIPSAMNNANGSMAFTAIFCGQNTSPAKTNGQTGCWTINSGFTERVDVYRANPSQPNTGGCMQIADKAYSVAANDQPVITFAGNPNRRCALAISFRRSGIYDNSVYLLKNGSQIGSNYALTNIPWPIDDAYQTYGGPTDKWGTTWSYTDINSANFGGVVSANVEQGTGYIDHMRMRVYYSSVLPIDLVNFTVSRENNTSILSWVTATEINSKEIQIERSSDGNNFYKIGVKTAAGTSTSPIYYIYKDQRIEASTIYYRLKLIDNDGTFRFSDIRSVEPSSSEFLITPNPVSDWASVLTNSKESDIYILDQNGKMIHQLNKNSENTTFQFDMTEHPNGQYYMYIIDNDQKKILHFQKMR
ncbi:MAG: T9SS type A sorting domain-containing protein [Bacteroidetes bacterium]|nr:T9SS type A sorting domain-containing protein [Bacteroidota bacterium]